MRRTATLSTAVVAVLLALAAPACAEARADGDEGDGWDTVDSWPATPRPTGAGTASGSLELDPADAGPGATVTARTAACGGESTATGDASAVGAGEFTLRSGSYGSTVSGTFEVPSGARPGVYPVSVTCRGGAVARMTLTVSGEGGTQLHGVHAGDGGSLGRWSAVQLGLGGALVAGALGAAGYHVLRRRAQES
ncbi:hypothetical protein [Streptomyces sp. VRA16 Mangrove soil]|uniref:hypothetical protein n=1 Tax=Streptomyces sp. VRA16 Mangrove soil TaxID=2817434 RepID=UPI001A9FBC40|nr:hypothetical protein [Streptomyces sp. VRA16 Mangrove soil]MBO1333004.1 hypothetical protein [Streptomyces sp. VRA16 Mangrove soil]